MKVGCLFCPVPTPPASLINTIHVCVVAGAALEISGKQRVRLHQQSMAMAQYCGMMCNRAKIMLRFIEKECPSNQGNVLTLFRKKYPTFGLRAITKNIIKKFRKCVDACAHTGRARTHTHIFTVIL